MIVYGVDLGSGSCTFITRRIAEHFNVCSFHMCVFFVTICIF